jgi:hypothetical protein
MEFLHKTAAKILGSPQLRDVLLYSTLLLIFTTAWVVDRWPDFAIPVILVVAVILVGEGFLIYVAKRRIDSAPDA